ncbi:MAG: hypothetical protein AAF703_00905 [Cyanobacteria bacterium P01_D01_bin.105]
MKYWEFLIQKEGDQTWLPLETQQVEILEGRYRVVAHTDRANTAMDVRVSQLVTDEMPPRRRVRQRRSTTNTSGLVVVMPFVQLSPGQWDVQCSSLEGEPPWQYSVQIQVFAHTEEDWSGEWPIPSDDETASSITVEGEGEFDPDLINPDLPLIQAQAELEVNSPDTDEKVTEAPIYRVALKQQAYLAHPKLPMTIVGQVSALTGVVEQAASQLWIRLQNPETAEVIMEASRPLSLSRLPADFKVQIQLPTDVSTRVILGEVSLRTEASDDSVEGGSVLATKSFTISAGIADLLEAIANQDTDPFPSVFEEEVISMPSLKPVQKTVAPTVGTVLPPKLDLSQDRAAIHAEKTNRNGHVQPDLPDLNSVNPISPELNSEGLNSPEELVSSSTAQDSTVDNTVGDTLSASATSNAQPEADSNVAPVINRPPMVAQPAQFLGTSIEDSDIEADEIAAMLEDIDKDLSSHPTTDLEALEAPGIEAALPQFPPHSAKQEPALTEKNAANLEANEAARSANRRSQHESASSRASSYEKSPRQIEASLEFQTLRLKDHFWNRLSNLTHESHKEATKLAERMKDAGVSKGQADARSNPAGDVSNEVVIYQESKTSQPGQSEQLGAPAPRALEQKALEQRALQQRSPQEKSVSAAPDRSSEPSKIVDRLLARNGLVRPTHNTSNSANNLAQSAALPSSSIQSGTAQAEGAQVSSSSALSAPATINPEDLPEMALPVISAPMGDLVAGEIITVTVRTRPSVYKPLIKLWMIDRQSRSLVIEPKLLTNMTPDALGDLETSTQLQIPMHCLDVQIAAISIDMATQQESAKAIVNRHVVPADQAILPQDDSI